MKKFTKIKVIKRQNAADRVETESETRKSLISGKPNERELAARVGDWVKELRERKKIEETGSFRRLFGDLAAAPNAA